MPGHTRIVESSTPLPALVTRQSFAAVELYLLPIVWASDCRIKALVAVTSVTDASRNVTGEIGRFIGGLVVEPTIFYDVCKLGTVQDRSGETPDTAAELS